MSLPPSSVSPCSSLLLALVFLPVTAIAADTIEVWDRGSYNAELHVGAAGFHGRATEHQVTNDFLLGRGLSSHVSAYVGACLTPSKGPEATSWDLCTGFLATVVDTDHVDVDFVLDASIGGENWDALGLLPMFEFNFDHEPELAAWGLYLRTSVPFWRVRAEDPAAANEWSRGFDLGLNPGAYWTLSDRHQVLVEYDVAFEVSRNDPGAADRGRFALGLNTVIDDRFEIVTHVQLTVPAAGDSPETSIGIGLIGTLDGMP